MREALTKRGVVTHMNWSLLQSGIGIEIQGGTFKAICVKRQWKRLRVAGRLEISQYQRLGPQQCGKLYREFLRKNGLKAPWTVVALRRSAVLLRWLNFPPAVKKELARAVEYQLDSLHPFEEGSVYWDFAPWKTSQGGLAAGGGDTNPELIEVLVAIAEKKPVEEAASWFQEAGIGVSQFTVTTAALLGALGPRLGLRPMASRASQPFFFLHVGPESLELAGYAPGISLVSKEIPIPPGTAESDQGLLPILQRELELARSELRLDPEDRPPLVLCGRNLPLISQAATPAAPEELRFALFPVDHFFPSLKGGADPAQRDGLGEDIVAFAAALAAADHTLPFSLNLLPPERRSYQSTLAYLPAYALSGLIVLLALALVLRGPFQDWRYNRYLEQETQALQPQLQAVEAAQQQSRRAYERLALLGGIRNQAALPLEILNELTRLLPEDVSLQQMQYDGETISLTGTAKSASPLLQTLADSSYFEGPQFLSAISRTPEGKEVFRIGVRIRKAK